MEGYDIQKRRVDLKRNQVNHIEMKKVFTHGNVQEKRKRKETDSSFSAVVR